MWRKKLLLALLKNISIIFNQLPCFGVNTMAGVSLLILLLFYISNGVRNGYSNNGFKWDVQRLAEETAAT